MDFPAVFRERQKALADHLAMLKDKNLMNYDANGRIAGVTDEGRALGAEFYKKWSKLEFPKSQFDGQKVITCCGDDLETKTKDDEVEADEEPKKSSVRVRSLGTIKGATKLTFNVKPT